MVSEKGVIKAQQVSFICHNHSVIIKSLNNLGEIERQKENIIETLVKDDLKPNENGRDTHLSED